MSDSAGTWAACRALFEELVDLSPAEQARRLDRANQPPEVVTGVREMLLAASQDGILDQATPVIQLADDDHGYSSLLPGAIVGGFTIDALIGRGGMGEVYLAHRTAQDFVQRVALKLLRPESAGRTDLFDRERQMLAGLEHPGIARLIDGGIAPDGRPYMAMEYVDGVPIDQWSARHKADLTTRLGLICQVCEAVDYAHARLVIHRDLKPSNILVDERGRVRLLDFGVAKLLDDSMTASATTQALVTPEYAAPEQLINEDSTVATDVYSLGVVMYQLVAGVGPWGTASSSMPSMVRRVLHDDPEPPSKAAQTGAGPIEPSQLRGDVDAIVMRAMRRVPSERYRNAAALSEDIGRHQRHEPVAARAGSTRYVARRFVRRHRLAVGASVAALVAILIGAGGIAFQARQTAVERDVALAEVRRSESIVRMLTLMFRDSATSSGEGATVKQMLDQTSARLVNSLDTSAKSATLISTLFDLYINLEDSSGADTLVRRARAKGIGKGDPVSTAELQMREAASAAALGRTEDMAPLLDAAEPVFRTAPERYRGELVDINSARAQLLRRTGKLDGAIKLLVDILPQANIVYAENHRDLLTIYNNILVYMSEANQLEAMPAIIAQADGIIARTGQQKSMQGLTIEQLKGVRLYKLGQYRTAETVFADVAAQRRAVFGRSAGLAVDLLQLGRAKLALGKFAEAAAVLGEARPMAAEKLSPAAPPTLIIGMGLAEALAESGQMARAEQVLGEVEPSVTAAPKPGIPNGLLFRVKAIAALKRGDIKGAGVALQRAEAVFVEIGPPGVSYLKPLQIIRSRIATAR